MFSLSQTTGSAIQAMSCLGSDACSHGSIQNIADCSGVPKAYLAKILKRLNEAGLVKSKRGYKGGVWLARPADEISLLEISVAIDGDKAVSRCLLGDAYCDDKRDCPTHKFWKKERAAISNELAQTSLAEVVEFNKKSSREQQKKAVAGRTS